MHFGHSHAIIYVFHQLTNKKNRSMWSNANFSHVQWIEFHIGPMLAKHCWSLPHCYVLPFLTRCSKILQWCKHHRCTSCRDLPIYRITGDTCLNANHIPVPHHFLGSFAGLTSILGVFHCAMFWSFLTTWTEANLRDPLFPKLWHMQRDTSWNFLLVLVSPLWWTFFVRRLVLTSLLLQTSFLSVKLRLTSNWVCFQTSQVFCAGKLEVLYLKAPLWNTKRLHI